MKKITRTDVGLLILRLSLGLLFVFYGSMKLFGAFGGRGYSAQVEAFVGQGFHPVLSHLAIWAEFLGGLGLIFGFLTPAAAFGIVCVMATALFRNMTQPDAWNNLVFSGESQHLSRFFYPYALLSMALAILVMGAGKISLDAKLFRGKK